MEFYTHLILSTASLLSAVLFQTEIISSFIRTLITAPHISDPTSNCSPTIAKMASGWIENKILLQSATHLARCLPNTYLQYLSVTLSSTFLLVDCWCLPKMVWFQIWKDETLPNHSYLVFSNDCISSKIYRNITTIYFPVNYDCCIRLYLSTDWKDPIGLIVSK